MKALIITKDSIGVEEVDRPSPANGEVLIKIEAAALNRRDQWIREGLYPKIEFPVLPGSDGCGIVEATGSDTDKSWLGKRVLINPNINWGDNPAIQNREYEILGMPSKGTLAEYIVVKTNRIAEAPSFLSSQEAGALPLAGLTAYNAIFNKGQLSKDKKVLISGVGGGVAQFALQFALAVGAKVWVTTSKKSVLQKCMDIGAQGGANYKDKEEMKVLAKSSGGFDIIVDSAGGPGMSQLIMMLGPGGRLVFYGATVGNTDSLNLRYMFWNHLSLMGSTMGSDEDFAAMLRLVEQYKIKPIVDKVYPLEDAVGAFDRMKESAHFGKIVVQP